MSDKPSEPTDKWIEGHKSAVLAMQKQLDDAVAAEREACALMAAEMAEECRRIGMSTLYSMSADARLDELAEAIRKRT